MGLLVLLAALVARADEVVPVARDREAAGRLFARWVESACCDIAGAGRGLAAEGEADLPWLPAGRRRRDVPRDAGTRWTFARGVAPGEATGGARRAVEEDGAERRGRGS